MFTLTSWYSYEETIKKSVFICHACPIGTVEEAFAFFQRYRKAEATHNCWAFKVGDTYRFNDDGEPSATAGRPILQAIEGQAVIDVAVLVIRYFGGVKLGTGGLVRAYGGVAAKCLQQAPKEKCIPSKQVSCSASFSDMGIIKARLLQPGVVLVEENFNEQGVVWLVTIPEEIVEELEQHYINLTRGKGNWVILS